MTRLKWVDETMVVVLGYERREDILYESLNLLNSFPFISSPEKICAFHHKKKNHCSNNREVNVQIVINGVISISSEA